MIQEKEKKEKVSTSKIPFEGVSQERLVRLAKTLNKMAYLHEEVEGKRNQVIEWRDEFKSLIRDLLGSDIPENDKKLDESVGMYVALLDKVLAELRGEIAFFSRYLEKEPPSDIEVTGENLNIDSTTLFDIKIASMTKNAKTMKRDLQVSFSRYEHGLGRQIKQFQLTKQFRNANPKK